MTDANAVNPNDPNSNGLNSNDSNVNDSNSNGSNADEINPATRELDGLQQVLAQAREQGDRLAEAAALNNLAFFHKSRQQMQEAIAYHEQALEIFQALGDRQQEAMTIGHLATAYYTNQDYEQSLEKYQQCLPIFEEIGDRYGTALTWYGMGGAQWHLQQIWNAQDNYRKARDIYAELGMEREVQNCEAVIISMGDKISAMAARAPNLGSSDQSNPESSATSTPARSTQESLAGANSVTNRSSLRRQQRRTPSWLRFISYFILGLFAVLIIAGIISLLTR